MCQEVGHTLGLDHQDENFDNPNLGTCMDYTRNPGTNQHPNQHDYAELEAIYSHFDSTTTVLATTASPSPNVAAVPDAGESPAAWGRAVAFTVDGRGRVYQLDIGSGRALFTFVLWAPDRTPPGRPKARRRCPSHTATRGCLSSACRSTTSLMKTAQCNA
jgi:hypothetical protein